MKKFILACLLALPVIGASQQQASAWHYFNFGVSGSFHLNFGGAHGGCGSPCGGGFPGGDCGWGGGWGGCGSGYSMGSFDGWGTGMGMGYAVGQAPAVEQAPEPTKVKAAAQYQPTWDQNSGYQPVGYYYPNTGYGYYQAPSYWYGR